jgi:hypothetical protein
MRTGSYHHSLLKTVYQSARVRVIVRVEAVGGGPGGDLKKDRGKMTGRISLVPVE